MKKGSIFGLVVALLLVWFSPVSASYSDEFAYVGSFEGNSIRVMDLENGSTLPINNVRTPEKIFITPNKKLAYVLTSRWYGGLVPIDITTHTVRPPGLVYSINVNTMAFSPDSQLGYVGTHNSYHLMANTFILTPITTATQAFAFSGRTRQEPSIPAGLACRLQTATAIKACAKCHKARMVSIYSLSPTPPSQTIGAGRAINTISGTSTALA